MIVRGNTVNGLASRPWLRRSALRAASSTVKSQPNFSASSSHHLTVRGAALRDLGYVEHMGLGVPRKIIAGMRARNDTDPDLVESGERFTVRLWR
jgi:hypothetical protein